MSEFRSELRQDMDEESSKVTHEEDRVLPDKNSKRTFKTHSQLAALEKLYNEHNYPKDFMKTQVAEKIGLSERQVSIWLCHRRNKQKKLMDESCENGRLDRSSAVRQDYGHGSCDSFKPGDYRDVLDPIDVMSSDGGCGLQDVFISQEANLSDINSSRYSVESEANIPINENDSKTTVSFRPSGYLKLTGNIEHAAITAVKRQLGRRYWPEGPVLGVEFEPLPHGAFEMPLRDLDGEPYGNDPNGEKTTNEQSDQYLYSFDVIKPTIVKRKEFSRSKYSTSLHLNDESLDMADEESSRKNSKHKFYYGGLRGSKEYRKAAQVKMNPANDMMIC